MDQVPSWLSKKNCCGSPLRKEQKQPKAAKVLRRFETPLCARHARALRCTVAPSGPRRGSLHARTHARRALAPCPRRQTLPAGPRLRRGAEPVVRRELQARRQARLAACATQPWCGQPALRSGVAVLRTLCPRRDAVPARAWRRVLHAAPAARCAEALQRGPGAEARESGRAGRRESCRLL